MAQRHRLEPGNWQSVFRRLEELVLANSGQDEFQEVFKLLIAKLYQENYEPDVPLCSETASGSQSRVEELLTSADRRWPEILADGKHSLLYADHLQVCVAAIDQLSLRDTSFEVMDALFEYLISRAAKGDKGQYFTPRHVVEAIVQITAPQQTDLVADPACGSSGFLVHAMQAVTKGMSAHDKLDYCKDRLWGFDIDPKTIQVARALMVIAGDGRSNLYRVNSLLTPTAGQDLFQEERIDDSGIVTIEDIARSRMKGWKGFDVIVTNPPFAGEVREPALLRAYELARPSPKRNERDVLFIERCVHLLAPGGRLGIVLPNNKVGGSQFDYVRSWLIKHMRVVAVLSLGRNTFRPHTSQKAEVVFAVKRPKPLRSVSTSEERILFLSSEKDGKDSKGNIVPNKLAPSNAPLWERSDHDLADTVATFRRFVADEQIQWGQKR